MHRSTLCSYVFLTEHCTGSIEANMLLIPRRCLMQVSLIQLLYAAAKSTTG